MTTDIGEARVAKSASGLGEGAGDTVFFTPGLDLGVVAKKAYCLSRQEATCDHSSRFHVIEPC